MRALVDVNMLIALFDAGHTMHARAMAWLENQPSGAGGAVPGADCLKGMDLRSSRGSRGWAAGVTKKSSFPWQRESRSPGSQVGPGITMCVVRDDGSLPNAER